MLRRIGVGLAQALVECCWHSMYIALLMHLTPSVSPAATSQITDVLEKGFPYAHGVGRKANPKT